MSSLVTKFCEFKVWAWGTGPCLGMGNAEAASMLPREIDDLSDLDIVDISVGDSHCLALVRYHAL